MKTKIRKYFPLVLCGSLLFSGCGGGGPTPAPVATLSTNTLTFSTEFEGTTSPAQSLMLSNTGNAALTVASIAATGDFGETNNCTSPLEPGTSCTISVTFKPGSNTGDLTGTLLVTDNAAASPQTVALSGTGTSGTLSGQCFGGTIILPPQCIILRGAAIGGACAVGQPTKELESAACTSEGDNYLTFYYDADSACTFRDGKRTLTGHCEVTP